MSRTTTTPIDIDFFYSIWIKSEKSYGNHRYIVERIGANLAVTEDAPVVFDVRSSNDRAQVRSWDGSLWAPVAHRFAQDRRLGIETFRQEVVAWHKRILQELCDDVYGLGDGRRNLLENGYRASELPKPRKIDEQLDNDAWNAAYQAREDAKDRANSVFDPFKLSSAYYLAKLKAFPKIESSNRETALAKVHAACSQVGVIDGVVHVRVGAPMWRASSPSPYSWAAIVPECRITDLPPKEWPVSSGSESILHGWHDEKQPSMHGRNLFAWDRRLDALEFVSTGEHRKPPVMLGEIEVVDRSLADWHERSGYDLAASARNLPSIAQSYGQEIQDLPDGLVREWMRLRNICKRIETTPLSDPSAEDDARAAYEIVARLHAESVAPGGVSREYGFQALEHAVRWTGFEILRKGTEFAPQDAEALGKIPL